MTLTDGSKSESLLRLGLGYWSSKAFLTACELKLFTLVHQGTDSVEVVARALAIPHRSARILMDAMASLDLLAKEGGSYETTDLSSELLVEGMPDYMGDFFVAVDRMFYKPFVQFEQALREGRPVWSSDAEGRHQPVSREEAALFTRAMHGLGKLTAQAFGRSHDLSERTHLLDIGGGSGVMSIGVVQRNPLLEATVLDRPAVCEVAKGYISQAGLLDKINTLKGDIFTGEYPPTFDVHLYSNVLHNFKEDDCLALLAKSYRTLPSNGEVIIIDYLLGENEISPEFAVVFNLFALVAMDGGETRTFEHYKRWLESVGFRRVGLKPLRGPSTLVRALKGQG